LFVYLISALESSLHFLTFRDTSETKMSHKLQHTIKAPELWKSIQWATIFSFRQNREYSEKIYAVRIHFCAPKKAFRLQYLANSFAYGSYTADSANKI